MEDTGPGPVPISASKSSKFSWVFAFFWFSSIDLICLLRTRGSWWGESCAKKTTWQRVTRRKVKYRHCHLFDGEGDGVADLGQGVHAALVRPGVPRLRRADHQRPVVRSDPGPETVYLCQNISTYFVKVFIFPKSLLNIWVSLFLRRLSFPDSISREGQQLKKSICNMHSRINFL